MTALLQWEIPSASTEYVILASTLESTLKQYDVCSQCMLQKMVCFYVFNMYEPSVPMVYT